MRRLQHRKGPQNEHQHIGQVVVPKDGDLFQQIVQRIACLHLLEEIFDQAPVIVERALPARHVVLEIFAFAQLSVKRTDEVGMLRPTQFAGGEVVVDGIAVGDGADDRVVDELGVGVKILERRQLLGLGDLDALPGIPRQLDGKGQHQKIEIVSLVDGSHERLLGSDHVVGIGLEMGEQRLGDLDTE